VELIQSLEQEKLARGGEQEPWFITASFVNPHDIVLFGDFTQVSPLFHFEIDPTLPEIPPAPTQFEDLCTKPIAQKSYREVFKRATQPISDQGTFRKLYYSLQKKVDQDNFKVFEALRNSIFYEDTIVLFTADHGEILGSHGGQIEKWYQAYEEAIHVPLIIHNPHLFPAAQTTDVLTSHVDVLPTMLGLANANVHAIQKNLEKTHTEMHSFVGRDLSSLVVKGELPPRNEPVYFMTDDDVTKGLRQVNLMGQSYESVIQPNHVETVILWMQTGDNNQE
jgi:arylsulfatase A-like enzyme